MSATMNPSSSQAIVTHTTSHQQSGNDAVRASRRRLISNRSRGILCVVKVQAGRTESGPLVSRNHAYGRSHGDPHSPDSARRSGARPQSQGRSALTWSRTYNLQDVVTNISPQPLIPMMTSQQHRIRHPSQHNDSLI
jgi:hypothetical protein